MSAARSLAELAAIHPTDKVRHGYLAPYERHFAPLRESPVRLLEIGIGPGGSLPLWRDYFENGLVIGLDINDKSQLAGERIRVYRGDQADPDLLRRIVAESGGLDVVIDDGSHVNSDVLNSFRTLFPLLAPGGLYVIEDMHTSYWRKYGGEHRDLDSGRTSVSFVKRLVDGLHCHWIPGRIPDELDLLVTELHCYPKLAFVYRGVHAPDLRPYEERMMQDTLTPTDHPAD